MPAFSTRAWTHSVFCPSSKGWANPRTSLSTRKCMLENWLSLGSDNGEIEVATAAKHCVEWSSLIAGLDCGLDRWTGLLDWITELTFELKLCVSHDLHPIRCAELGPWHVRCLAANRLPAKKQRTRHAATVGVLCLKVCVYYSRWSSLVGQLAQ